MKFNRKKYMKEYNKNYRYSLNGWLHKTYSRITEKGYKRHFTIEELKEWVLNNGWDKLYTKWELTNYQTEYKPSLDRINDYGEYTFDNLQLITWLENWIKGQKSEKIKHTRENLTSFTLTHKKKVKCVETGKQYNSIRECSKDIKGSSCSKICNVCKGLRKHHLNLHFEYVEVGGDVAT